MPVTLHLPTLFLCSGLIHAVAAALLLRVLGRRTDPFAGPWAGYSGCVAVAHGVYGLRGALPDLVLLLVAAPLALAGVGLLLLGAHRLRGGGLPAGVVLLAPALWILVMLAAPGLRDQPRAVVGIYQAIHLPLLLAAIAELLRARRTTRLRGLLDLALILGVGAAWAAVRLLEAALREVTVLPPMAVVITTVLASALPFLALGISRERAAVAVAARAAAAQRAARAELERLHAGLPAVVFLREVSPDGAMRLLYRGGDMRAVYGWPPETFLDMANIESWTDAPPEAFAAFWARVLRDGVGTMEYNLRQPDGGWRALRSRCRVVARAPDGRVEAVGYVVDISAERAAEARALAAARLASLGEMATGMAHELRQPLAAIALGADLAKLELERGAAAAAGARLEEVAVQASRAGELIEHLRRFARGPEGGLPARPVRLADAVAGALTLAGSALREVGVVPELALGTPAPVALGDLMALEQVLVNLLLNARDALATRPPGAARRVVISAATDPATGAVLLEVADTGGGIPAPVLARLFEPFVTTKGPDRGTGLGLSICHGLIGAMGGSIAARNVGEGAVVTLRLRPVPAEDRSADPAERLASAGAPPAG